MTFFGLSQRLPQYFFVILFWFLLLGSVWSEPDTSLQDSPSLVDTSLPVDEPVVPEDPPVIDPPTTTPPPVEPIYSAQIQWQSPTYLLIKENISLTEYTCNPENTECKINLLVLPLVDGIKSSELTCEISSDFEIIPTKDPCNPNTSVVPIGEHILSIKILKKSDKTVMNIREILLKKPVIDTSIDPLRVTSTLTWQSPTYLLSKEGTSLSEYTCDPLQSDCKINLLVAPLLDGLQSSQLTCEITSDFPLESTADPCNPNTSLVPIGEHMLSIKILQKSDKSLLSTREILLKNPPVDTTIDPLRITSTFTWQSPTYLLLKDDTSLTQYTCDPLQSECKINLLVQPLLDGFEGSQLTCEITSDFALIPTSEPCNPNTSIIPTGDHILTIKILQKSDNSLLVTRELLIKNPEHTSGGGSSGGGGGGGVSLIDLSSVQMIIQSGLDADGRCRSDVCQVNFLAEAPTNALCHWDFGTGVFDTIGTDTKCNPGYVKFPFDTAVRLTVSDPTNLAHSITQTLQIFHENSLAVIGSPEARIELQGVIGKNKRLTDGGISCDIGKDVACSLNFTGEKSLNAKTFFWNFGNGNTSEKENPAAEKFALGRHRVHLKVINAGGMSTEAYFDVEVVEKFDVLPEKICIDCDKMKGKIYISAVLPNPPHTDTVEWIEIQNLSSEAWDLSSCILSDEAKHFSLSEKIGANKTLRFRQAQTGISLGNTQEMLELRCGEFLIDTFSWDFPIPSGYILRREMLDHAPKMVTVVQTVDGDTIDVILDGKKTRIRLLGVDTPETVHPMKSVEKFGKEASDFTKKTLTGKSVWMTFDHELLDHYGRTLGYIWQCDGAFDAETCDLFNARLISEGYARMERRFEFMYYDSFNELEKTAKKHKIGIWSDAEVARDLEKLSDEEAEKLKREQEEEYLRLQQELLELEKIRCEQEGICDQIATWANITEKMTTFAVRSLVSGVIKISGRTWGNFLVKIKIFFGEQEIYSTQIRTNTVGEYELEWYPKILGEYRVEALFEESETSSESATGFLTLQKNIAIDTISEHFLTLLTGKISVQGKRSKNRWIDEDGIFQCRSRGSCTINLDADYNRKKDILYTWTLPNGDMITAKNPPSFKVGYGDFVVKLQVHDTITGEKSEDTLNIHHAPIRKAPKKVSTKSSKYTLDLKDATTDIGGGVSPEVSMGLPQSLLALFVLGILSLLFFGKRNIDTNI